MLNRVVHAVVATSGSLTPLAPISMQEMKLSGGLGLVLEAPGLSPYHTGTYTPQYRLPRYPVPPA